MLGSDRPGQRVARQLFYKLHVKRAHRCQVSLASYLNVLSTHKYEVIKEIQAEMWIFNSNDVLILHVNPTTKKVNIITKFDNHYCLPFVSTETSILNYFAIFISIPK